MTFPWAQHYDPGVPLTVGPVNTSLPRLLLHAAEQSPQSPALVFFGRTTTYGELNTRTAILASAPPRQIPWTPLILLLGLLLVLVVAAGIWWRYSQPVIATKEVPASSSPTVAPAAKLSADDYYNLGNEAKDTDDKIKYYAKAIELNPYNAQFYYYRGRAYNQKNLFPLAIEDFGKAIMYQPNYPSAYASRGFAYYEMGQQDAAIKDYTKSISLDPNYAVTFFKRGVSYQKKGDNAKALADYTEAIRLRPGYVSALNNRGNIYIRKGEYEKANNTRRYFNYIFCICNYNQSSGYYDIQDCYTAFSLKWN